ncbi:fumarate reductase flavoprotein subunit [Thalassobaculum fulvum]|uniref:Fumarate reductase flavoprotein subunit n=1 Tax=Thalassobaculum fulvum TaxID=1633335 RepID=A0A919CTP3_9PROT|nr:FAD-dependent oxidoreductase [Thalassobaculum fulvum]GHD62277.1 fumarate reductase flavoprotein subunit [Thalassobaculum fulvum]
MSADTTTDLLVIGAGACGLAAAIAAHDAGIEVAIVEKLDRPGGNSALSTGSIPGAGSRYQREAGIEDSPDRMVADLLAVSGHHDADPLTRLMAEQSAPLVEWLIDGLGARMRLITEYRHVGHSVPRLHAPSSRRGQDLVDDLLKFVANRGIPLAVGNPVDDLIVEDGAVMGAVIGGEPVRAAKVLLATNGFAGSREMVRRWCPEIAGAEYFGALGSTGEAVRWGERVGAALGNMAAYQGYAAVAYPQGSLLSWTTIEKGGILVGADGRRFGNEDAGYSGYAPVVMGQGEFAWAVYDRRIHDVAMGEEEYAEMAGMGGVRWGATPAIAAQAAGIDQEGLTATVAAYNAAASGEAADAFGRTHFNLAPLQPPFGIVKVKPGLFHTQGGLLVDDHARVLRPGGSVVSNLFAGGGAAAGISGRSGAGGYASGNGLLTALGLGRIAGLRAAAEVRAGR